MGKTPAAGSKKAVQKEQKKIIEDKTFGLKNKNKSSKVQKHIQHVTKQVENRGPKIEPVVKVSKKEEELKRKEELNELFKPVQTQQKVPVGVDPKSVICQFHKQGLCTKGSRCKFSHDLDTRKTEKIDIYTDRRDLETDTMDQWDENKLTDVVSKKRTEVNQKLKTDIICKYFLEAIENSKYGWFWECPNGGDKCQYVHALPPGFVLKKKKKEVEDEEEEEPPLIEELIEEERRKVEAKTPVTLERFRKWKEDRLAAERARLDDLDREEKKKGDIAKQHRGMSGREMFSFNPELFVDDEDALVDSELVIEDEIDPSIPHNVITVTDVSITLQPKTASSASSFRDIDNDDNDNENDNNNNNNIEVNESLFEDDVDLDLPEDDDEKDREKQGDSD